MNLSQKKILITGAAGFIGFRLAQTVHRRGMVVHGVIRPRSNPWRFALERPAWFVHEADMLDPVRIQTLVQTIEPNFIVHCAVSGVRHADRSLDALYHANVIGTAIVLQAAQQSPITRLIHLGGSSEYGPHGVPLNESMKVRPMTDYGGSKAAATIACQQFGRSRQLPVTILRPFSVYGPGEADHRLIPTAIMAALNGRPMRLTADRVCRDFIFVDDVVEAIELALKTPLPPGEIINVASGVQHSNHEVIELVERAAGRAIPLSPEPFPPRPGDTPSWVGDRSKAADLLGWLPQQTLEDGIQRTVAWFRDHLYAYV